MEFITNINPTEYDNFVRSHKQKSHFLQSYAWGQFSKTKGLIPHYVGLKDNNKLICVALLLQKKLPFGYSYFYSPRGYIIDFNDFNLLKRFTTNINTYVKSKKGIFIKIDPDIKLHDIDDNAVPIHNENNNYKIINNLINLGYKHNGYNKYFESIQPRYTFRIDLTKDINQIKKSINKSFMHTVKKSYDYDVEISKGTLNNIHDFYELMILTGKRDGFTHYPKNYYINFFKTLDEYNMCHLFVGRIYPDKIVEKHKIKLEETQQLLLQETKKWKIADLNDIINKLSKEINEYEPYIGKYPRGIIISAHIIVTYGDKVWELYASNHDLFKKTNVNNRIYIEEIEFSKNNGYNIFDQFGTIGDFNNKSLVNLHNYKKKLGGEYLEFIGEFDLIVNRLLYFLFIKLIPFYRNLIKLISRKKRRG